MGKSLQHKRVLSIDLSAIMAGSGIRGQFEEKFKALVRDIEEEVIVIDNENENTAMTNLVSNFDRVEMSSVSSTKSVSCLLTTSLRHAVFAYLSTRHTF